MRWLKSLYKLLSARIHNSYASILYILKHKWSYDYQLSHKPLLDTHDLVKIQAAATANINKPYTSRHEVSTLLIGERSSAYAGSGYEFAENQLYVAGDDSRFINWRLLARTGKLYRKKFIEERRPELWIIMDKRATMRFGTRKYLKVTQAAIQALYHLYQAQQQQMACGGIVIDEKVRWHSTVKDLRMLDPLIRDIISPAPPLYSTLSEKTGADTLNIVLRQLASRALPGSIIILLSDFLALSEEVPISLYLLRRNHQVIVKHIIDPIELELPSSGKYQVTVQPGQPEQSLDCDNEHIRDQYKIKARHWQQDIKERLTRSGAEYRLCMSNDSALAGTSHE